MNVGINLFKVNTHFIEKSFCFREYLLHLYGIPRVWAFFFFFPPEEISEQQGSH